MANTKVTGDLIASSTIVEGNIANSAVTGDKIANSAITSGKISGITTAHITEGSNLYYTDARADARITAADTGDLSEGSNLYYTNARADARVTVALIDEDNMLSNSATRLPSQQSVKAYVDAQILTKDNTDEITEGSSNLYYTDARADARVTLIIDSAPSTLNTLNELAAALGDDANFSTTVTNSIGLKAPLASPTFTGTVGISATIPRLNFTDLQQDDWAIINDNGEFKFQCTSGSGVALLLNTSNNATFAGNILFATDGTYDIGSTAGSRPRDVVVANSIAINTSTGAAGTLNVASTGTFGGKVIVSYANAALDLAQADGGAHFRMELDGGDETYLSTIGSNSMILRTNSTTALTLDTGQNATFAGDVTIGGKTYPKISLTDNQGVARTFSVGTSNETFTVRNETASSDAFTISNANNATFAGNVAINGNATLGDGTADNHTINGQVTQLTADALGYKLHRTSGGTSMLISATGDAELEFGTDNGSGTNTTHWTIGKDGTDNSFRISNSASLGTSDALTIDSSENSTFAGNVTISKSNTAQLQLIDTTNNVILLQGCDDTNAFIRSSVGPILLQTNGGTTALTLDSSQNATFAGAVTITGKTTFNIDADSVFTIEDAGTNAVYMRAATGDEIYFGANNNYQLRLQTNKDVTMDNGGNFGIGTSSPSTQLHVYNASAGNAEMRLESTSGGDPTITFNSAAANRSGALNFQDNGTQSGQIIYKHNGDSMEFYTGGASSAVHQELRLKESEGATFRTKVGIGKAPTAKHTMSDAQHVQEWVMAKGFYQYTTQTGSAAGNFSISTIINTNNLRGLTVDYYESGHAYNNGNAYYFRHTRLYIMIEGTSLRIGTAVLIQSLGNRTDGIVSAPTVTASAAHEATIVSTILSGFTHYVSVDVVGSGFDSFESIS